MPWRRNSPPSRRLSPSWPSNSPRLARTPRPPPSRPPPTSSSHPSRRPAGPGQTPHRRTARPSQTRTHCLPARSRQRRLADHRLDFCPGCGHDLRPALTIAPRVVQQVDIAEVPLSIQEHRSHPGWCPHRRVMHQAPLPPGIERGGLVGPSLTTLIAYLKGACHASFSTVRKFLRDVVKVTISRGNWPGSSPGSAGRWSGPTGSCSTTCPARRCSTSMRPATSRTASGSGPGASGPGCTRCSRSTRPAVAMC